MRILTSKKTCQTAGSINKKVYKDFYEPLNHQQKWEGYLRMICFLLWVVSLVMCILANALFLGHYPLPNRDSIDNCVYYDVNYPFLERRMRSRMMHSDRSEANSSPNLIWRDFFAKSDNVVNINHQDPNFVLHALSDVYYGYKPSMFSAISKHNPYICCLSTIDAFLLRHE